MERGNNQWRTDWGNVVVAEAQVCYVLPGIC
jgi:hypothetical protein